MKNPRHSFSKTEVIFIHDSVQFGFKNVKNEDCNLPEKQVDVFKYPNTSIHLSKYKNDTGDFKKS